MLADACIGDAELLESDGRWAAALFQKSEQDMLGIDKILAQLLGFAARKAKHLLGAGGEFAGWIFVIGHISIMMNC